MGTRERLQRLVGEKAVGTAPGGDGGGPPRNEELRALRERIEAVLARRPAGQQPTAGFTARGRAVPLEELLPGCETANAGGSFFCAGGRTPGSARHGHRAVRDLTPLDMDRLAILGNDPALKGTRYHDALFIDTETTGLAGGTGTVAFLVGLGWFDGDAFVTRQLFARDYGEERAVLLALAEVAAEKRFLVSFNGKAFDVNLLAARFIMNRLPDPLTGLPHLDLLHPARRLFSHRLADRRLASLEAALLGFEREGDVPGSEIPRRFFDWLRRRDGRLMADVFEHNRLDILSLAALASHLAALLAPCPEDRRHHPGDRLAAARLLLARAACDEAVRLLEPLLGCGSAATARAAAIELSLHHKRSGQWPAALAIWEGMVGKDGGDPFALIELAKWQEHRCRDFPRALDLTERAALSDDRLSPEERSDLAYRRARLRRKSAGLEPARREGAAGDVSGALPAPGQRRGEPADAPADPGDFSRSGPAARPVARHPQAK